MAQVFIVTGKLGSGKSLVCVGKIRDYLNQGRMVATNLDLNLEYLVNPFAKNTRVFRVPDKPKAEDIHALPTPYHGEYDESKTGLLVLDECGTWLNSRNYRDSDRGNFLDLMLHIRKMGWDVMLIVQHFKMLDSQAREALGEQIVQCRRSDRLPIPFIGFFSRLAGFDLKMPKLHLGLVTYGNGIGAIKIGQWIYRGTDLYQGYDTRQIFRDSRAVNVDGYWGLASMLPPNTVYGRLTDASTHTTRTTKRAINRFLSGQKARSGFLVGVLCMGLYSFISQAPDLAGDAQANNDESSHVITEVADAFSQVVMHPLQDLWITASVHTGGGYEYVFYRGQGDDSVTVVDPSQMGYRVRWNGPCSANLVKPGEQHTITCYPYEAPKEI